jgi:polysaccharide deacetylase family protein (PEP-CTERM system associated)
VTDSRHDGWTADAPLLLSVDFEDWHQLVRRRVGAQDWQRPGPALQRQTDALLALLDELGVRATFFVLGMAARTHPTLVRAIAERGHEIACHGDQHLPVHRQTPAEFATDLRSARATIGELTGSAPAGYRAPAFSITASARWAYEVLAAEGFAYDSSQHDSPRIRGRVVPASGSPHALAVGAGATLWEFPLAVWRAGNARMPVGGASYWAMLPTSMVLRGLLRAGPLAGLYLHPHELDPEPLRAELNGAPSASRAHARVRAAQRNLARRRAPGVLRAIARQHPLITYGEAHAQLSAGAGARSSPLSRQGAAVRRPLRGRAAACAVAAPGPVPAAATRRRDRRRL